MRYFLDTEFIERGHEHPIELISLGLVAEDGRELYAVLRDGWFLNHASDWILENVIPHLNETDDNRMTRAELRDRVLGFTGNDTKPIFVGYYSDYDWVLFAQLFGRMIDLPEHFPKWCWDLKQIVSERQKTLELLKLPEQTGTEHNALADARWIRDSCRWLEELVALG